MRLDEPLTDKEFDELDQFLLSDRCAEDAMTMDCLHGYLTAIAIGPLAVAPADWLPSVWGEDQEPPRFKNPQQAQRIWDLIIRFYNEIVITLEVAPKEFEPLFCEIEEDGEVLTDAEAWAWGFCEGMLLREDAWEPLLSSDQAVLLGPILLLGADEIPEEDLPLVETAPQRNRLALEIEANLPLMHRFWLPRRKTEAADIATIKRDCPKVGRNDLCPCGSGKKHKKCCGAEPTLH